MKTKSIIVTGAGSGIGLACALKFLENGYCVGLIGRARSRLERIARIHEQAVVLVCDVSKPREVNDAFECAYAKWGRLDALFNNAGVSPAASIVDEVDELSWQQAIEINLNGSFYCARKAFELMRRQKPGGGRIINNGSISAHSPRPGSIAYTTTKHAMTGLTKSISLDGRAHGIACGQIDIGNAETEMVSKIATGVPQADGSIRGEPTMDVQHVANAVFQMAELPLEANVQFMTIMATSMPFVGRG